MEIRPATITHVLLVLKTAFALLSAPSVPGAENLSTLALGYRGPDERTIHGTNISIPITYSGPVLRFSSFNLRFAYNERALLLRNVDWGRIFPNIPTVSVHYQLESLDSTLADNMNTTVHLMALSQIGETDITVAEMIEVNDGDTLAILGFRVSNDRTFQRMLLSLRWLWTKCGDNQIVAQNGILSSRSVTEPQVNIWRETTYLKDVTDSLTQFPSLAGAPTNCDAGETTSVEILKDLSFVNGGVYLSNDQLFVPGDINLNGISAEFDDMKALAEFITLGKSTFTVDTMALLFMLDVNSDEVAGDLCDFVLLLREVTGEGKADFYTPDLSYQDTVTLTHDALSINSNRELAALLLVFDGPANVTVHDKNLQLTEGQIDGDTYVLLYGLISDDSKIPLIPPGTILETKGVLKRVEAANYDGYKLHTIIAY